MQKSNHYVHIVKKVPNNKSNAFNFKNKEINDGINGTMELIPLLCFNCCKSYYIMKKL